MKRINAEEAKFFIPIDSNDPFRWSKTVAYSLLPTKNPLLEKESGWEDVAYYSDGILDSTLSARKPEWVYVLVNKSMPGVCKIGMTTTSVPQRVREINSATGVITPWIAVYKYECINSYILEQAVHRRLQQAGYRVNPKREGFEIPSDKAIEIIEALGEELTIIPKEFNP